VLGSVEKLHEAFEFFEKMGQEPSETGRFRIAKGAETRLGKDMANYIAVAMKLGMPLTHNVVLVPGIRDDGDWFNDLRRELETCSHIKVINGGFSFFQSLKLLLPGARRKRIEKVAATLRSARGNNQVVSVICHSFGSYCVTRAILENTDITVFRLAICGSIVPNEFAWDRVVGFIPSGRIINDCGNFDAWPLVLKAISRAFGDTGRVGFGKEPVRDRWHDVKHNGFFGGEFIRTFWLPFFKSGVIVPSDVSAKPPGWMAKIVLWRW